MKVILHISVVLCLNWILLSYRDVLQCDSILQIVWLNMLCWVADKCISWTMIPLTLQGRDRVLARWFLLYSLANFCIAGLCPPALQFLLQYPTLVFDATRTHPYAGSSWPLMIGGAIHMYHCSGSFDLSVHDIFHHILFVPTLCLPGMLYDWGCL